MPGSVAYDFSKASFHDPAKRVFDLLDKHEIILNRQYLAMIQSIKDEFTLREIEQLIVAGRLNEALAVTEAHVNKFASQINGVFVAAGESTAGFLDSFVVVNFDLTNIRAVNIMRTNKFEFVREFMAEQRIATRQALIEGITSGVGPRAQARLFRGSIGLTQNQVSAVANYRRLLQEGSSEALTRKLRDARFDRTVKAAIRDGRPLSAEQINRMTSRYQERYLKYRSEVIARTESLSAVHSGKEEMYAQAFEDGVLDPDKVISKWHTARDARVRDTHWPMSGQERRVGDPFRSGAGVSLRFPGDPQAPAKERVQCRCGTSTTIRED